jgi:hypothetical protein
MNVNEILEDLSYSWSSMEAQDFNRFLLIGKTVQAKKMLLEEIGEKEANAVMKYFKEKHDAPMDLEAINAKDIVFNQEQQYLFKLGSMIYTSTVRMEHGKMLFFARDDYYPIDNATQIWIIKKEIVENAEYVLLKFNHNNVSERDKGLVGVKVTSLKDWEKQIKEKIQTTLDNEGKISYANGDDFKTVEDLMNHITLTKVSKSEFELLAKNVKNDNDLTIFSIGSYPEDVLAYRPTVKTKMKIK